MCNIERYLTKGTDTVLTYKGSIYHCPHHVLRDKVECPFLREADITCYDCWKLRGQAVLDKLALEENKNIITAPVVIDTSKFIPGQAIMITKGEEQFDIVVTEVYKDAIRGVGGSKTIYRYDISVEDILNGKVEITLLHGGENEC